MLLKLISLFGIEKVLADNGVSRGTGTGPIILTDPLGGKTFIEVINSVLNFLIYISVPILALMILVGGFQILWAKDSSEKVQKGKDTIKYAVIGFTVVLCSKGVALVLLNIIG